MNPANWKPAILIWRWEDAPEEFRALAPSLDTSIESVIYVPTDVQLVDGSYDTETSGLWFLGHFPKAGCTLTYAGDDFGWYALVALDDGSRVAYTTESRRPSG
jgi:hypothetical protein